MSLEWVMWLQNPSISSLTVGGNVIISQSGSVNLPGLSQALSGKVPMVVDGQDGDDGAMGVPGPSGQQGKAGASIPGMDGQDGDDCSILGSSQPMYIKAGSWTPSPTGLSIIGTPTYIGTYTRIADRVFCVLQVQSTVTTASTEGTTTFSGLPYAVAEPSAGVGFSNGGASVTSSLAFTDNNLYTGTWAANSSVIISFSYRTTAAF
jgi:hypothetical protein